MADMEEGKIDVIVTNKREEGKKNKNLQGKT